MRRRDNTGDDGEGWVVGLQLLSVLQLLLVLRLMLSSHGQLAV